MSSYEELDSDVHALMHESMRPRRFSKFVQAVRKILWKFVKPFHVYHLKEQRRISTHFMHEYLSLRSELAAVKNRCLYLEKEISTVYRVTEATREKWPLLLHELRAELYQLKCNQTLQPLSCSVSQDLSSEVNSLKVINTQYGVCLVKLGDLISDSLIANHVWDEHILNICSKLARLGYAKKAIDIGAHMGAVTMCMAHYFEKVVAFEPNDFNFKLLRANMALNHYEHVQLYNTCLFSSEKILGLSSGKHQEYEIPVDANGNYYGYRVSNSGAYSFTSNVDSHSHFVKNAHKLDDYDLQDVSFIKIDVQGADGEVILGALETIQSNQPVVVFEWEEYLSQLFNVEFSQILSVFEKMKYSVVVLKKHNDKQIDYLAIPEHLKADF